MIKRHKLNKFCTRVLQMIYPWHCVVCGLATKHGICSECLPLLPRCQQVCQRCGLPLITASSDTCGQCLARPPHFDHIFAAFWFLPPIDRLIVDYKYHQRWENLSLLATLFAQYCPRSADNSYLIAMPSHDQRVRQRGFNAVYELLKAIRKHKVFNYSLSSVARIRNTEAQTGMRRLQRQRNMRKAFALKKLPPSKHVIIFDDVVTTGATVNELAKTIKCAGVERVDVWALARTIK
mgnify:FL=1